MAKVVNGMSVPQLTRKTNYDNLCLQIKALLRSQDVWNMVEEGYVEPDADEDQMVAQIAILKKTHARDGSALYFLYNAVDESGFKKIANAKSAKEAWKILEVAYKGDNRIKQVRIQALKGEFEQLKKPTNKGEGVVMIRLNPTIKHYRYSLTRINLGLLRVEILAAEEEKAEDKDEVDVVEAMKREPVSSIGMTEDKEKVEEISQK
ncbi:uncharacterized protein LOC106779157 [Vigna radiata var. radiata]|uniref:Uncharacterized protein LOC106779157 n=1 Tax=Vigna radiata var. radiata TaxID=3916 RepID=A0A1S3VWY5_VIGRR|nr:uncharacterized protein LOC106779157 [Vigna radiata var. radiata]